MPRKRRQKAKPKVMDDTNKDGNQASSHNMPETENFVSTLENLAKLIPNVRKELSNASLKPITDEPKEELKRLTEENNKAKEEIEDLKKKNKELTSKYETDVKTQKTEIETVKRQHQEQRKVIANLESEKEKVIKEINRLREQVKEKDTVNKGLQNDVKVQKDSYKQQDEEKEVLQKQKALLESELLECKTRLSSLMGVKLNDNNPAIADLSDKTRPLKLGEKFSELYDNEWTDAFECLQKTFQTDKDSIQFLLKLLEDIKIFCEELSKDQHHQILCTVFMSDANEELTKELSEETKKRAEEFRRETAVKCLPKVKERYKRKLRQTEKEKAQETHALHKGVEPYVDGCVELCWLMLMKDPPVVLGKTQEDRGISFNSETYKEYTVTGPFLDYIVWPALYLHDGGSLLAKGVAQAFKDPTEGDSGAAKAGAAKESAATQTGDGKQVTKPESKTSADKTSGEQIPDDNLYKPTEDEISKFKELAFVKNCYEYKIRKELGDMAYEGCCRHFGYEYEVKYRSNQT